MRKLSLNERLDRLTDANVSWQPVHQEMLDNIRCRRCHLTKVDSDDAETNPVYSIGLWHHFKHPEIVTFGLSEPTARALIEDMQDLIKVGQPPAVSTPLGQGGGNYPVHLERVIDRNLIQAYLPLAVRFYEGDAFPVLQLFWSDPDCA